MSDIWFIFNNNGDYLFRTSDKNRANLTVIPSHFNASYIIRNPEGFISERNQNVHYDIQSDKVIFSDINSVSDTGIPVKEQLVIDYGAVSENINELFKDRDSQNSIISENTQKIETLQNDLQLISTELSNLIKIFNNIFNNNNNF